MLVILPVIALLLTSGQLLIMRKLLHLNDGKKLKRPSENAMLYLRIEIIQTVSLFLVGSGLKLVQPEILIGGTIM